MVNFFPSELLTSDDLNQAFSSKADLTTRGPQTFLGQINVPLLQASTALVTVDLTVTGSPIFSTTAAMTVPIGTTLQRPLPVTFGMIRANRDTGAYEVVGQNGAWAQLLTQAAPVTPATPPSGLAGVTFGVPTQSSIPVNWKAPTSGTAPFLYTLQFRVAGTSNWINWLTDITDSTTSATVSGLLDATRYEFQLLARNTAASTASPITSSATLGFATGGPANLVATSPTSTTVFLSWDAVSISPIAYQVRYAVLGDSAFTNAGQPTSDLFRTVTGLQPNTTYVFQVQAKNTSGSFESNTVQFGTAGAAAFAPSSAGGVVVSNPTISSLTVNWNAPVSGDGAFAYQVEYQQAGSIAWTPYKTPTTQTSLTVNNLNSATSYSFHVIAINSAGTSTSSPASGTTLAASPVVGGVAEYQATPSLPTISGPVLAAVAPGGALDNMGIKIDDPPAAYLLGSLILSANCGSGTITMNQNGNPIAGSGTNTITSYASTLGGIMTALASLAYTASITPGSDAIRITITDQMAFQSSMVINITVGGQPVPSPTPSPSPGGGHFTATGQPTDVGGIMAFRAADLTNTVALSTRFELSQYNQGYTLVQAAIIENQINYIGNGGYIQYVREISAGNMNQSWLAQVSQNCGSFYYILAGDAVVPSLYSFVQSDMQNLVRVYPFVQGFEGFDPGVADVNLAAAIAFQASIDFSARQSGLATYQMAPNADADYTTVGSQADRADVGVAKALNIPSCPNGPYPPINDLNGALKQKISLGTLSNPNSPVGVVIGYQQFQDGAPSVPLPGFVSETVAAKYLLEAILNGMNYGAYYIALHELMDGNQLYGLFRNDGTPKKSAQALRIMFQLMGDPSAFKSEFAPGNLNFTITGTVNKFSTFVNTGLRTSLYQDTNGTFYLWMWNEQPLNDSTTNATITPPNVNVTLTFNEGFMQSVSLYDPFTAQTFGGEPLPYVSYTNPTQIVISLPPYPICARVTHT